MNAEDEKVGVDDQPEGSSSGANEPISSPSELEEEKRTTRDFYAQNNTGHIQVFIQSLESLNLGVQPKEDKSLEKLASKTYNLRNRADCADFVEHYKCSDYLAIAIILSVFELVALSDLPELQATLVKMLPAMELAELEDTATVVSNPYISTNTFLATIGGKQFVTEDNRIYVGLGENFFQAFQNLWELFPSLRDSILEWLIQLYQIYQFRTAFDAYQMSNAFAKIISLDFVAAKKHIFSKLYSEREYTGLLGGIVCKLYDNSDLREDLTFMLKDWANSPSWLWRPLYLAYSFLPPEIRPEEIDILIKKTVNKRLAHMTRDDSGFFAILLMGSEYFRTLFSQLLNHKIQKAIMRKERLFIAQNYLYLIRNSYYLVDASHPELPLVTCDTADQLRALSPVLSQVISHISLRRQLYAVLRVYLKEISNYCYTDELFDHTAAYFYKIVQDLPEYQEDIREFLSDCRSRMTLRLCNRLFAIPS